MNTNQIVTGSEVASTPTEREKIFMDYECDAGNLITNPGKFEREPIFAPYFWQLALEGFADRDDGTIFTFKFAHSVNTGREQCPEFEIWPELKQWLGRKRTLRMAEDSQGFVHCY